ncbi:PQQ-binding-like beta-propeller repeat protein [Streptomyces sp. CA-111067]|uniref:outer membrane protein assembly factor BamB family protein n=1 Tax=Streptomyces sp. CA-111067 TaxID=3240046 RepID=UPI003D997963
MSQPPPPPGNPPKSGASDGAVPPPSQAPGTPPPPPPVAGYGYPAPGTPPPGGGYGYPAQAATPPPGDNPYAQPVQPGQNPYAQAPTQAAFPPGQFQQQGPPPPPPYSGGGQQPPPPPYPGQPGYDQQYAQAPQYAQQPPYGGQFPGQQGQPGQQPGQPGPYGYQTPPPGGPYGAQPPYQGAPSGGGNNNKMLAIIAAAVVAVLVIAGGVYLGTKGGGGGDDPKPPVASSGGPSTVKQPTKAPHKNLMSFQWDKAADTVAEKDNLKDALGIWFTDKYVVKNEINKVVAYDLTTGAQAWVLPSPSRGDCTAARDTYKNYAAIQTGPGCDQVMVFDLTSGKSVWTAKLPGGTGAKNDFDYAEMAISGDTVGIDWLDGSIAYRISTQKVLWQSGNGNCEDDGYAGGAQFVAVVNCDYKTYKVQLIDPDNSGNPKWSWTAPTGTEVNAIVSTDPVVVLLGTQDKTFTDVATIVGGRLQSRISLGTDKYNISDDGTEKQAVHSVLVTADTVYLSLSSKSDSNGQVLSGIVAFNTSDGKQKWIAKPSDKHDIQGLAIQDGKLLAYEPSDYDVAAKLVLLDPATGAITPYSTFDSAASDHLDVSSMEGYNVWHNEHFYVVAKTVYAGNQDQHYLASFG